LEKLNYCSEKTGMTKADIIRKGIDLVYNEVTKK
jgi:predicted DNA-binding protein